MLLGLVSPADPVTILVAGDSDVLVFYDPDHPASSWSATFVLNRNGTTILSKAATISGDYHSVALATGDTSGLSPGIAQAYMLYTSGALRETLAVGTVSIAPNPSVTMTPTDAMAALAAVKQTITKLVSMVESSASFNGQTFTLQNISQLFEARDRLQAEVNNELLSMGLIVPRRFRTIVHRFT